MRIRPSVPLALALLAALASAEPTVLKRSPKVGDRATYAMAVSLKLAGADVTLKGTATVEITKVEDGVITTKTVSKTSLTAFGQQQDTPEATDTQRERLDGSPLPDDDEEGEKRATSMRLANLNQTLFPAKPVEIGDTWTTEGKKDEKLGTPAYKIVFRLEGGDKVGEIEAWKIHADGTETEGDAPSRVKATYWVEKATGRMLKTISEVENFTFEPGAPPATGRLEVTIQP